MNILDGLPKKTKPVVISPVLWQETWKVLRQLGRGEVESACVWGGVVKEDALLVQKIYPIVEDEDERRGALWHRPSRKTTDRVFDALYRDRMRIVCDVHTHPLDWVGLSDIDMEHPIEYRHGLLALVIPGFAMGAISEKQVGAHVYGGSGRWYSCKEGEIQDVLLIEDKK